MFSFLCSQGPYQTWVEAARENGTCWEGPKVWVGCSHGAGFQTGWNTICGNYKVSLTRHLVWTKILFLSKPIWWWASTGGQKFTKLDLSSPNQQMVLKYSCQYIYNTHWGIYRFIILPLGMHRHQPFWRRLWMKFCRGFPLWFVILWCACDSCLRWWPATQSCRLHNQLQKWGMSETRKMYLQDIVSGSPQMLKEYIPQWAKWKWSSKHPHPRMWRNWDCYWGCLLQWEVHCNPCNNPPSLLCSKLATSGDREVCSSTLAGKDKLSSSAYRVKQFCPCVSQRKWVPDRLYTQSMESNLSNHWNFHHQKPRESIISGSVLADQEKHFWLDLHHSLDSRVVSGRYPESVNFQQICEIERGVYACISLYGFCMLL